ncbi:MAG: cytochrome c [Paracoccaceae bacterium]|nr:cytochrome c [Paracoccaceae bacterium]MDE3240765.1 cytochrome c [Paracoccaceae bacterium]
MTSFKTLTMTAVLCAVAAAAVAQTPAEQAVNARKSLMHVMAFNLGQLGAMAKGQMPYDAKAAQAAAGNIAKLATLDQAALWMKGTDHDADPKSHALPAIWQNEADFLGGFAKLASAAGTAEKSVGGGAETLKAALGQIGGACGGCHKSYRAALN